ncbi:muts domain V-domain-containing protein [Amylostereum chailletii]|nr:muts domain V-domain-containing protein [Amylostereum chailletii]
MCGQRSSTIIERERFLDQLEEAPSAAIIAALTMEVAGHKNALLACQTELAGQMDETRFELQCLNKAHQGALAAALSGYDAKLREAEEASQEKDERIKQLESAREQCRLGTVKRLKLKIPEAPFSTLPSPPLSPTSPLHQTLFPKDFVAKGSKSLDTPPVSPTLQPFPPTMNRRRLLAGVLIRESLRAYKAPEPEVNLLEDIEALAITPPKPVERRFWRVRSENGILRRGRFISFGSSIGALLDYLARERAVGQLEDEGIGGLRITGIETLTLDEVMQINADALASLQIFENESHASIHSDKTKEGLSLFGILNNTKTALGLALMRTWLLRPSLSIPVIAARHDAVACFTRPENLDTATDMHDHLKGIKNIPKILATMKTDRARIVEWQGLVKFVFHSAMLRDKLSELSAAGDVEIVRKLVRALDNASFKEVGTIVNHTSAVAGRVCVRAHVDEELDNRKHVYNGIDAILSNVAEEIGSTLLPSYATSINVVYFPQLGFLICIPYLEEWKTGSGIEVPDGWTFQFSSESHVYFKNTKMHDLDTHLGDLYTAIVDRELELIQELQEKVLQYADPMNHACHVYAELDCLLCFAEASTTYDYRRPQMSTENILCIKQGRHPLQEQVVDTFVPNGILLVGGAGNGAFPAVHGEDDGSSSEGTLLGNSVMVCTGANACGKSVYLKQVALIQFMAQIGCFVPAESAILGTVDKIFTRVQTRESVSKVQSAFMIDLNQVSLALRNSTSRSLILLDEFGKGTISTDGAGLFCGVIRSLLARGEDCPKVIATTHFHEVFRAGLMDVHLLPISFVHMEVMFTNDSGNVVGQENSSTVINKEDDVDGGEDKENVGVGDTITYLYRVANGLSLHSHAARCAELCGIPSHVVQRARYVSELLASREITRLLDEAMTEEQWIEMEKAEEVCRRFLTWDLATQSTETEGEVKAMLSAVLCRENGSDGGER